MSHVNREVVLCCIGHIHPVPLAASLHANCDGGASRLSQVELDSVATAVACDIWAGGLELADLPHSSGPAAYIGANS